MNLIAYYPGDTFLHRLDPRVKIIMLLIMTVVIFLVENFLVISCIFLTVIFLWASAKLPFKSILSYFKFLLSLFAFLTVLQALFYPGDTILVQPLIPEVVPLIGGSGRIALEGIIFGALLCFRLITLVCLMPLITMTTPIHLFALGLVRMGMNYKIAYTATTAINLIPTLQTEVNIIMDAQKMRGFTVFEKGSMLQKMKAYPALVVPLVIGAMRRAQMMGVAMNARAFGAMSTRTYVEDIRLLAVDWIMLGVSFIYVIVLLIMNFRL